ncbi:hypothetical protein [Streptomyces sp. NPDC007988]|uniref:DUF7660 family protein n=1 Tax=Streptomyces sp. NPDC007988 TaxID=3364802 RepID=UPI0036E1BF0F
MTQPMSRPADEVTSRQDLALHIRRLRSDLLKRSDQWENATLESYLEAMAAWIEAAPHWYRSRGEEMPAEAEWTYFAQALSAAVVYE